MPPLNISYKRMKVTIVYVSKYGATEQVVQRLAKHLNGWDTSLVPLMGRVEPQLTDADCVVLATPVYAGKPHKLMKEFCKDRGDELAQKPLALIACGMEPKEEKQQEELAAAYPEQLRKVAVAQGFFFGAFNFEKMNFFERFAIKRIAKTSQSITKIDEESIARFAARLQASVPTTH